MLAKAFEMHCNNDFAGAAQLYESILNIDKNNVNALKLYGTLLTQKKDYTNALKFLSKAIKINIKDPICLNNKGICLKNLNRYEESLICYDKAIKLNPKYDEAFFNRANLLEILKRYDEAIHDYDSAIAIRPEYLDAIVNRANTLGALRRFDEAIQSYETALSIHSNHEKALIGISHAQRATRRYKECLLSVEKILELKPSSSAYSALGDLNIALEHFDIAVANYASAINLDPHFVGAWFGKGLALSHLCRYAESIECFLKVIELDTAYEYGSAICLLVYNRLLIADWKNLAEEKITLAKFSKINGSFTNPLLNLALINDQNLLHELTLNYSKAILSKNSLPPIHKKIHNRIRIGYFSSDFKNHPVSLLLSEVFKLHNREIFEVIAFCLKRPSQSDFIHEKLRSVFDYFIDVDEKSDQEVAQIARELELDIAIDLGGHTLNSRLDIFALRSAPIQVSYFGYAGTTGIGNMDYIVADRIVLPAENQIYFSEKIAYLPNSYMVDDSKRLPSELVFTRADFDLPANKFVFCCFNNSYKFNFEILSVWAKILLNAPDSVIWLSENNSEFAANISRYFLELGISQSRIIFSKKLPSMADHLARYRLADVFLDTHPYNAHTTALDALKMGVPVLTYCGKTFAGRVAASLLTSLGLDDLIAHTIEGYESKAIELYSSPEMMMHIRQRLVENLMTKSLFNTGLYVNNLEVLYLEMYRRHLSGLPPETFDFDDVRLA